MIPAEPAATGTESNTDRRRTERILSAAQKLFLAYGMRRTSMDDIAREAGIAKGTIYLSFKSRDALFKALTQRLASQFLERAQSAAAEKEDLVEKLAAYLDEAIGEPGRLLASTGHAAEILDAKLDFATEIIADFDEKVLAGLADLTGRTDGLPSMLVEAAHGCKHTGSLASPEYRARLDRHVATLLRGVS